MPNRNVLGLTERQLDQPIYRIIPVKYLYPIFENKQNLLVSPKKWNDPFENFILRSKFRTPAGDIVSIGFRDSYFGQCWSTRSQSEALWRLYSDNKNSVRIRSTPRKLFRGLATHLGKWARTCAFIGKVQYFSKKRLLAQSREQFAIPSTPTPKDFAQTFLFKRRAFSHEQEIRLLFAPKDDNFPKDGVFAYPVTPTDIVDDIRIDPRLDRGEEEALVTEIQRRTGFKGTVKRSDLYDPPPTLVLPFGRSS